MNRVEIMIWKIRELDSEGRRRVDLDQLFVLTALLFGGFACGDVWLWQGQESATEMGLFVCMHHFYGFLQGWARG